MTLVAQRDTAVLTECGLTQETVSKEKKMTKKKTKRNETRQSKDPPFQVLGRVKSLEKHSWEKRNH